MSNNILGDSQHFISQVDSCKQTIASSELPQTYQLANKIADMMEEEGITLADLLEDLPQIREEIYQEQSSHAHL